MYLTTILWKWKLFFMAFFIIFLQVDVLSKVVHLKA
jgi:hypothetical protein